MSAISICIRAASSVDRLRVHYLMNATFSSMHQFVDNVDLSSEQIRHTIK